MAISKKYFPLPQLELKKQYTLFQVYHPNYLLLPKTAAWTFCLFIVCLHYALNLWLDHQLIVRLLQIGEKDHCVVDIFILVTMADNKTVFVFLNCHQLNLKGQIKVRTSCTENE